MNENEQHTKRLYPGCGREYGEPTPAFCYDCVAPLESEGGPPAEPPGSPRSGHRGLLVLVLVLLLAVLAAGGITAGVLLTLHKTRPIKLPATTAELKSSLGTCRRYLNEQGSKLAAGRARGATVYSVKARLNATSHTVSGSETLLFTNRTEESLDNVVLRVYANDAAVRGQGSGATIANARAGGRKTQASLKDSLLSINLPQALQPGGETILSFWFKESVPEVQGGLSVLGGLLGGEKAGGYGIFGRQKDTYNLGYLVPMVTTYRNGTWENREVPPFGDVSDFDCAYFNVSLDVPEGFGVVATGVQTGRSSDGGRRDFAFAAGPVRDFAAQAMPTSHVSSRQVGQTRVSSYYSKDSVEGGKKVLDFACNALEQYAKHIGPYPYTNLNVCEAPLGGGAGGMEFAGQILIAQMLYGGRIELPKSLEDLGGGALDELLKNFAGGLLGDTLEFTVAHEVCHQWWGIVVGSDSINSPWMDESLCNYCSVLFYRWQHGAEAAKNQLNMQLVMPFSAMSLLGQGDAAVDAPVTAFKNQEQYTAIVYCKGALFFDALEKRIGSAAFARGLKSYYAKNAFLEATPEDLLQAFKSNAEDAGAVAALRQRWLEEEHADEDISSSIPGGDMLENLLKGFGDNLKDLGPMEDLLKDFMNGDKKESAPDSSGVPVSPAEPTIGI